MEQNPCKIYYCYKATNIVNGKVYIGFASDPKTRWRDHKRDANKGRGYAFAAAIRKYGWDSFEFDVICCGKDKREMLEHVEPALIEQHQSSITENGYNMLRHPSLAPCGMESASQKRTGKKLPAATRQKMSESQQGHEVSLETREKISKARKGMVFSEEHRQKLGATKKGRTHSEETKRKMSASHMGHVVTEETRRKIGAGNSRPRGTMSS